jgi:hypothetical protein
MRLDVKHWAILACCSLPLPAAAGVTKAQKLANQLQDSGQTRTEEGDTRVYKGYRTGGAAGFNSLWVSRSRANKTNGKTTTIESRFSLATPNAEPEHVSTWQFRTKERASQMTSEVGMVTARGGHYYFQPRRANGTFERPRLLMPDEVFPLGRAYQGATPEVRALVEKVRAREEIDPATLPSKETRAAENRVFKIRPATKTEMAQVSRAMGVSQADTDRLAQDNYGAVRVIHELGAEGARLLDQQGIRGGDIWLLYKDLNGQSAAKTLWSLKDGTALAKLKDNPYSSFYRR